MLRPIVKWAGGKRQLLPELMRRLPPKWNTYYEPFIGGGALLVELYNKKLLTSTVISDLNEELINLYQVIKKYPLELIKQISSPDYKNDKETYLKQRERFNEIIGNSKFKVERAALFLYLNRHCYNGLWRVNKSGKFNVPFGRYKNPNMPSKELILEFSKMLEKVRIMSTDFENAVKSATKGDLVYFDPPYQPISSTAYFTDYTSKGFGFQEQERLARVFNELSDKGVFVILSNSESKEIYDLYKNHHLTVVEVNRAINSKGDKRTGAKEVIITNYLVKRKIKIKTLDEF